MANVFCFASLSEVDKLIFKIHHTTIFAPPHSAFVPGSDYIVELTPPSNPEFELNVIFTMVHLLFGKVYRSNFLKGYVRNTLQVDKNMFPGCC